MGKKEWSRNYYLKHKDEMIERYNKWKNENPFIYRSLQLSNSYKTIDRRKFQCENDLSPKWIRDNIMNQPCAHCGLNDWRKIGCNRLDNSKPHTKDNVEPCCWECNRKLGDEYKSKIKRKTVYQYTLDGELVKVWSSVAECMKEGFVKTNISGCCNGKRKTHKGYRWSYVPL